MVFIPFYYDKSIVICMYIFLCVYIYVYIYIFTIKDNFIVFNNTCSVLYDHLQALLYFELCTPMRRLRWSRGSVLAFSTQVRGFKHGRSRRIFKGEKILSTPSFGGEVKPSVPCRRFAACKRSLNGVVVVISAKLPDNILAHSSHFRRWDLSRRGWWWKVGTSKKRGKAMASYP